MGAKAIARLAKEFVVIVKGMVIARCRDFSLSIDKEMVDITTMDSRQFKEYVGDRIDWNISFSSLVTRDYGHGSSPTGVGSGVYNNLFDYLVSEDNDYPCTIGLGDSYTGTGPATGNFFIGGGILQGLQMDGSDGDVISYSGNVQGSGELKRGTRA